MKRTYTANIDGQIFSIDDDAFNLLQNYLEQLRITFPGSDGREIVTDIESRIRELFNERLDNGARVIVLSDVETVIETMGRPDQLGEVPQQNEDKESASTPEDSELNTEEPFVKFNFKNKKKLYRDVKHKVFGGVIAGLGNYLGWNANIMRILLIVLACFTYVWPWIIIYMIAWMVIPPALTPRQVLEMHGEPVNVETVGQAVRADSGSVPPPYKEDNNFFSTFFSILGKCVAGFVGFIAGCIGVGFTGCFLVLLGVGVAALCGSSLAWPAEWAFLPAHHIMLTSAVLISIISITLLGAIISLTIAWACMSVVFPVAQPRRATVMTIVITIMALIVVSSILCVIAFA